MTPGKLPGFDRRNLLTKVSDSPLAFHMTRQHLDSHAKQQGGNMPCMGAERCHLLTADFLWLFRYTEWCVMRLAANPR
jgi:hypothetical protein